MFPRDEIGNPNDFEDVFEIIINFLLHVVKTIKSLRFLKFHYL